MIGKSWITNVQPYRSEPVVNMANDMVRVTLDMPKHEWKRLLDSRDWTGHSKPDPPKYTHYITDEHDGYGGSKSVCGLPLGLGSLQSKNWNIVNCEDCLEKQSKVVHYAERDREDRRGCDATDGLIHCCWTEVNCTECIESRDRITEAERSKFMRFLRETTERVKTWPEWKQNVLTAKYEDD